MKTFTAYSLVNPVIFWFFSILAITWKVWEFGQRIISRGDFSHFAFFWFSDGRRRERLFKVRGKWQVCFELKLLSWSYTIFLFTFDFCFVFKIPKKWWPLCFTLAWVSLDANFFYKQPCDVLGFLPVEDFRDDHGETDLLFCHFDFVFNIPYASYKFKLKEKK